MTSHLYNDAESGSRGGSLAIVLLVGLVWIAMLAADSTITAVSFNVLPFWGGLGYISDGWRWRGSG